MALIKAKEAPRDTVELNEQEATSYAWELVTDWATLRDS